MSNATKKPSLASRALAAQRASQEAEEQAELAERQRQRQERDEYVDLFVRTLAAELEVPEEDIVVLRRPEPAPRIRHAYVRVKVDGLCLEGAVEEAEDDVCVGDCEDEECYCEPPPPILQSMTLLRPCVDVGCKRRVVTGLWGRDDLLTAIGKALNESPRCARHDREG